MKSSYLVIGLLALVGVVFLENKNKTATPAISASGQATVNGITGIATSALSVVSSFENLFKMPSRPVAPQSSQIYTPTNAPASTDLIAPPLAPLLVNTDAGMVDLSPGSSYLDPSSIGALPTDSSLF